VLRWVEGAEAELLATIGQSGLFGRIPRVHYEVDYRVRLWFGQEVDVEIAIARVGAKSVRYEFEVRAGDVVAASGNLVVTMATADAPGAVPWPDEVRAALTGWSARRPAQPPG
jgi:acyl-CoA thioester hydrolase